MGQVFAAVDTVVGRTVAIKRAAKIADRGEMVRRQLRLLAEAATIARLQHPGVVPLHDVGVDADGEPFFAMQRVAGQSLADLLAAPTHAGGERPLSRFVELLRRIAETMAYAHAHGVVHRDLKPANVMVGTYGEVYVMDWGLADAEPHAAAASAPESRTLPLEPSAALTLSGSVLGTPAYMAPERVRHGDRATAAADVDGLGAILYQVLTGAPPYANERGDWSAAEILRVIADRPPRAVHAMAPAADPELAAICERAIEREPVARYADMNAFAADLRAWSEHRVVSAHASGLAVHVRKWIRRNRAFAGTIAAAAAILLAATVWFVVRLAEARDVAATAAASAQLALAEILDLAVAEHVADLRHRADTELWPLLPANGAKLAEWLRQAEALRPARDRLRDRRQQLAARPAGTDVDADEQWRRRLLDTALLALDEFFAPVPPGAPMPPLDSTVAAVALRADQARELADATIGGSTNAQLWQRTAAAVKSASAYGGLELSPQIGLLPLGADPASGLQEFAHLQTGAVPRRAANGVLSREPGDAVVLVLLPGGSSWIGALPDDARHPDPWAETINEGPVHEVRLAPFFLAKFETTQAQWQRVTGDNPSVHTERSDHVDERAPRHPVESVDWFTARTVAFKVGLALPTEAQWEYAARAGTATPWYTGATVAALLRPPAGNLADARSAAALGTQGWASTPGLDDGFVMHAPVGSFAPNAHGLHDMLGNVAEWCADEYVGYTVPAAVDTGARPLTASPKTAMYRGGAFDQPAQEARSANRAGGPPTRRHFALGVRFARALAP